jgi:hypothetical protein
LFTENNLYDLIDGSYFGACNGQLAIKSSTGATLGYIGPYSRIALFNYSSNDAELFALREGSVTYATRRNGFYSKFKQITL